MSEDISLRARFERFPATVKGAFVVRGEDADPHQVAFRGVRVVGIPGPGSREIPLETVILDVPPHKDVFVPFEFPIGEFEPGWYDLEADLEVDGVERTMPGGRRFSVPWPRSSVRAANVRLDKKVKTEGGGAVSVERCQSGAEGLTLRFAVQPPQDVTFRLFGDDQRLDVVDVEVDPASGKGTARAYPLLRAHQTLRIEVGGKGKGPSATEIVVKLGS